MKKLMNALLLGMALTALTGCYKKDDKAKEPKKEMKKDNKKKPAKKQAKKKPAKKQTKKVKKEDKGY